jgi:hypothetical protein
MTKVAHFFLRATKQISDWIVQFRATYFLHLLLILSNLRQWDCQGLGEFEGDALPCIELLISPIPQNLSFASISFFLSFLPFFLLPDGLGNLGKIENLPKILEDSLVKNSCPRGALTPANEVRTLKKKKKKEKKERNS